METTTSSIILNGVLGKVFHYKRGVRHGDPLSPLLFVLEADILQSIVNKAEDICLLELPLQGQRDVDFPMIQYVNDTLFIMEACQKQLFVLKALLQLIGDSTGLKVNYAKSNIYPIMSLQRKWIFYLRLLATALDLSDSPTLDSFLEWVYRELKVFYPWLTRKKD